MQLSKVDAANRQLEEAICMHFERRDPVAVHTLASAASQVAADLLKSKGAVSLFRSGLLIREDRRAEVMRRFWEAENYFKHADRDPDAKLDFSPSVPVHFVFAAAVDLESYAGTVSPTVRIFIAWYFKRYPEIIADSEEGLRVRKWTAALTIDPEDFEAWLRLIGEARHLAI